MSGPQPEWLAAHIVSTLATTLAGGSGATWHLLEVTPTGPTTFGLVFGVGGHVPYDCLVRLTVEVLS